MRRWIGVEAGGEEEILAYDKHGDEIWISASVKAFRNERGQIKYMFGLLTDITESKQLRSLQQLIMSALADSVPALHLQAATGLLAVVVLLVIMNWFFHKIYWGGWIRAHNRRRKSLLANAGTAEISLRALIWGLLLLGFTSLYREGFEVVLFLQTYNLQLGGGVVLKGALLGLFLSGIVAVLTFVLQKRLPYRKMLISTGILLGVVLLVMVGEEADATLRVLERAEVPLLPPGDFAPYHAAEGLDPEAAHRLVTRSIEAARSMARDAIDGALNVGDLVALDVEARRRLLVQLADLLLQVLYADRLHDGAGDRAAARRHDRDVVVLEQPEGFQGGLHGVVGQPLLS